MARAAGIPAAEVLAAAEAVQAGAADREAAVAPARAPAGRLAQNVRNETVRWMTQNIAVAPIA